MLLLQVLSKRSKTLTAFINTATLTANSIYCYLFYLDYVSWRNPEHGSWFIQGVCEIFGRNAKKEEIIHLFTEVSCDDSLVVVLDFKRFILGQQVFKR